MLLEATSKMHLTPKGFVVPRKRDYTSIFENLGVHQTDSKYSNTTVYALIQAKHAF